MALSNVILIFTLCISFFVSALCFNLIANKYTKVNPFVVIISLLTIGIGILAFVTPDNHDYIYPLKKLDIFSALVATLLIYAASSVKKTSVLIIVVAAAACIIFMPREFLMFDGYIPLALDCLFVVLIWTIFSYSYKYINIINGIVPIQVMTISGGITLLYFLGVAPLDLTVISLLLFTIIGTFLLFNISPARLRLSAGAVQALGFFTTWLMVIASEEGAAPCMLIFSMMLVVECLFVFVKAFLPATRKNLGAQNTILNSILRSGLKENEICLNIAKLMFLLLILGIFQIYAPNNTSIPLLSGIFSIWFLTQTKNWKNNKSLKEQNQEFVKEIKSSFSKNKKNEEE